MTLGKISRDISLEDRLVLFVSVNDFWIAAAGVSSDL